LEDLQFRCGLRGDSFGRVFIAFAIVAHEVPLLLIVYCIFLLSI
jgi:hypothetical protein